MRCSITNPKPNESLKELKMPFGTKGRKEGIAVIDVDPESANYGNILIDIPLPSDLVSASRVLQ